MAQFSLLHLDDKPKDLETLEDFLNAHAPGVFSSLGVTSVNEALIYLENNRDTNLCVVDYTLNAERSPGSSESWNGITFGQAAKLVSPNTNFILLTEARPAKLLQMAAEVGYFGVIKKFDLSRRSPKSITDYLEYACYYSENFLRRRSDARLNFSQSVAHTLKSTLLVNQSLIADAQTNVASITFGGAACTAIDSSLSALMKRHTETMERIDRVLQFYTKLHLNCSRIDLYDVISNFVINYRYRDLIELVTPIGDVHGTFDRVLIELAIENLIDNSVKAVSGIEGRAPVIEITVRAVESASVDLLEVIVMDNGVGLKPGTANSVNLPFFTADNLAKGIASFGIGCAEAEKIAMLHRNGHTIGSLKVCDRVGTPGCIATLRIPRTSLGPNLESNGCK